MHLAVLVSGTGSILEAISNSGIEISLVVADRECEAIQRASDRGLDCSGEIGRASCRERV